MATVQGTLRAPVKPSAFSTDGGGSIVGGAKPLVAGATPGADLQNTLKTIISKNGPTRAAAEQLLQQLQTDPSLANDPSFKDAVNKTSNATVLAGSQGARFTGQAPKVVNATNAGVQSLTSNIVGGRQQDAITQQLIDNAQGQVAGRKQMVDGTVMPALSEQHNANAAATFGDQQRADDIGAASSKLQDTLGNLSSQQRAAASGYNSMGSQMYGSYAAGQNALNTQDQGTLSKYMSETDPLMTQLQAHGSNPQDIANQQAALGAATGIANGSLDYTAAQAQLTQAALAQAQLSQYSSNPADQQRQLDSYNKLNGIGNGSLDYKSQAAQAYANPLDLENQRKALSDIQADVAGGNKDQLDALNLIKSRTGNTATAEEAFLAEQARRKFEGDDRSSRDAVMQNLSQRGLRSGSAEIANQLGQRENLSQDRTLAELGLQASAMQRAQAYTGMQADQSNQMRNSQQNALGLQGNLSTSMRNASFDEAYKRGVGADTASANNQGTRLNGTLGAANQSNQIRNANDQVGMFNTGQANNMSMFNTGQANDVSMFNAGQANQTSQFNAGQQNNASANNQATRLGGTQLQASQSNAIRNSDDAMSMFQDNFASQEASRVGGLATSRAQTGLNTTNQIGTRNDTTYQSGANMLQTNYGRDKDSIALDIGNAPVIYGADTDLANAKNDVTKNAATRAQTYTGSAISATGTAYPSDPNQLLVDALTRKGGTLDAASAAKLYGGY